MVADRWVSTKDVDLHCLIRSGDPRLTPLVYVPGSLGSAQDFRDEMKSLASRTTIAVSPRGLGRSSQPSGGYSFLHRVTDLETLLDELGPESFCLMAYSLGVPVAIGYAARNPQRVKGLLLLDYPAHYPERPAAWLERSLPFAEARGIPGHVVRSIQEESGPADLWDELATLNRPVLLVKGGRSNALDSRDLERYRELPQVSIEVFESSDHEIHKPDYDRFIGTVDSFLQRLDAAGIEDGTEL